MREYDEIINWYLAQRNPDIGIEEISLLATMIPVGATVLDIGCGDGIPLSKSLLDLGFTVYGIDSSFEMINRYKANFPGVAVQCTDALSSDFFDEVFDAIVAYGMVFHLSKADQLRLIRKVSKHLKAEGLFLFNSGDEEDESTSEMSGLSMKQYSMSLVQYRKALTASGMTLVRDYLDPVSESYIYIGKKTAR